MNGCEVKTRKYKAYERRLKCVLIGEGETPEYIQEDSKYSIIKSHQIAMDNPLRAKGKDFIYVYELPRGNKVIFCGNSKTGGLANGKGGVTAKFERVESDFKKTASQIKVDTLAAENAALKDRIEKLEALFGKAEEE